MAMLLLALATLLLGFTLREKPANIVDKPYQGYEVNVPVSMGVASMKVSSVSFSDGQPGFRAPPNLHYAVIDMTIKNNSDQPINVLPSVDMYTKDEAGSVSYLTPFSLNQPFRAGKLLPGEQIKGELSFIVVKTGKVKLFVDSIWSGGVVPFRVQ